MSMLRQNCQLQSAANVAVRYEVLDDEDIEKEGGDDLANEDDDYELV